MGANEGISFYLRVSFFEIQTISQNSAILKWWWCPISDIFLCTYFLISFIYMKPFPTPIYFSINIQKALYFIPTVVMKSRIGWKSNNGFVELNHKGNQIVHTHPILFDLQPGWLIQIMFPFDWSCIWTLHSLEKNGKERRRCYKIIPHLFLLLPCWMVWMGCSWSGLHNNRRVVSSVSDIL